MTTRTSRQEQLTAALERAGPVLEVRHLVKHFHVGGGLFGLLIIVWWTAATVVSLIALLMEPGRPAAV